MAHEVSDLYPPAHDRHLLLFEGYAALEEYVKAIPHGIRMATERKDFYMAYSEIDGVNEGINKLLSRCANIPVVHPTTDRAKLLR